MFTSPSPGLPRVFPFLNFNLVFTVLCLSALLNANSATIISGELKKWHDVILTFDGPLSTETGTPNPFTDYRLDVTFTKGTKSYKVPGYFAADGNAANSSATSGTKWRVHFRPDETGVWSYQVSFRKGTMIAVSTDPAAGLSAGYFDGVTGTFNVVAGDKTGNDFRAKGRLRYVNKHYLQFAENGQYFIKGGADSPEGTLANTSIDNDHRAGTSSEFTNHLADWNEGDPFWKNGQGKRVIGAINYLAGKGINAMYTMTYTGYGQTDSVWPYLSRDDVKHFDCSKLDQWDIIFSHMESKGMLIHFVMCERQSQTYWEAKEFGPTTTNYGSKMADIRKLYYRELIARFGHHLGVAWNIGEENGGYDGNSAYGKVTVTKEQRAVFCDYIRKLDPYQSPIVVHTYPSMWDSVYTPLLNQSFFEGISGQIGLSTNGMSGAWSATKKWVQQSEQSGKPWLVCIDEDGQDGARVNDNAGARPDALDANHDDPRQWTLWGNLMAGGAGVEWYFGWSFAPYGGGDGSVNDYTKWNNMWDQTRYALEFFQKYIPFSEMHSDNSILTINHPLLDSAKMPNPQGFAYGFVKPASVYCAYFSPNYLSSNPSFRINFGTETGCYTVSWYNPRMGGPLLTGSKPTVTASTQTDIGLPPTDLDKDPSISLNRDWVVVLRKYGSTTSSLPSISLSPQAIVNALPAPATIQVSVNVQGSNIDHINLLVDGIVVGTTTSLSQTFTVSQLQAGKHYITANVYNTSGSYVSSSPLKVNVSQGSNLVVSMTAPTADQTFVEPADINLSAAVSTTVSKVEFYKGTTLLGSDATSPYQYLWQNVMAGTYTIQAKAYGSQVVSSTPITITVLPAKKPAVSITSPANGAVISSGTPIAISASASETGGNISRVDFYNGEDLIQSLSSAPYTFNWSNVPDGMYTLTAVAYDDGFRSTESAGVTVLVANQQSVTAVGRNEISLNGQWLTSDNTAIVPEYLGRSVRQVTYEKDVFVPVSFQGKRISLDFEAVNYIANVYVNGVKVAQHIGAWTPFSVDITNKVQPGSVFTVDVEVLGMRNKPIIDSSGNAVWPVGVNTLADKYTGIVGNVWLRGSGKVYIADAFAQTSVANQQLTVDYTLVNTDSQSRTVTLRADAVVNGSATIDNSLAGTSVTLAAGETKSVRLQSSWTNPKLWTPDTPNLYVLKSQVLLNGSVIDTDSRRFGFREITIEGNQFKLNGVRYNLWGDYAVFGDSNYFPSTSYTPAGWADTLDKLKSLNIREIRLHEHPAPNYALDIADEKGMVIVCESAIEHLSTISKTDFLANSKTWLKSWVSAHRNHPAILIWSAANGMGPNNFNILTNDELLGLGDAIRSVDPTRFVIYDGEVGVNDKVRTYHSNIGLPSGSIYSWASKLSATKPTGASELISPLPWFNNMNHEDMKWWQGIWFRGMRYVGFTDVRPSVYSWARGEMTSLRAANLRNAYASVALFDKAYDDLGIAPFKSSTFPAVDEGIVVNRSLILYNDEFVDPSVTIEVKIKSGSTVYASGSKTYQVTLGTHLDIPYSFQVPYIGGGSFDLVLTAKKGGVQKFTESRRFNVTEKGTSGSYSAVITLGGGGTTPTNVAPTITTQPSNQSVTAGQTATFNVVASGVPTPTYQWYKNGSAISGATSSAYTTPATSTSDNGATFKVDVKNSVSTVSSSTATLTVNAATSAPVITQQPTNKTVTEGQTATFSVAATGVPAPTYQWYKNGSAIAGATNATYTTPATTTSDNGATFKVDVKNSVNTVSSSTATLTVNAATSAPVITQQPANKTVTEGQTATFSVAATGVPAPTYQWYKNGSAITGATNATYTTPTTTTSDNGAAFKVDVKNSVSTVTSTSATLTVSVATSAPVITSQPTDKSVSVGQTATFTIAATGVPAPTFQWFKNGSAISGAASTSYTTPATTAVDNGVQYTVEVKNSVKTIISQPATLTVKYAPSITSQPSSISVNAGQTASFNVSATGVPSPGFKWFKNGVEITGAVSASYTTPATSAVDNGGQFKVEVSNSEGKVTSQVATLTVYTLPTITTQPASQSVMVSQTATFSVAASGFPAPTYQWKKNGTDIPGATASSYTTPGTVASDNGSKFSVVVSNKVGSVASQSSTLNVNAPNQAPTVNLISPVGTEAYGAPASIILSATATDDVAVDRVEFYNGTTLIAKVNTSSSGLYTYQWNNVAAGKYNITAVAFDGLGLQATSNAVLMQVDKIPTVVGFNLVDVSTKQVIQTLTGNDVLNLATLPAGNINIEVKTDPVSTGSVNFQLAASGSAVINHTENIVPYDLFGDLGGTIAVGQYSLTATPYTKIRASGIAGTTASINFQVINQPAPTIESAQITSRAWKPLSVSLKTSNSPKSFSISGQLPKGISFDANTGSFSGSAQDVGAFEVNVTGRNAGGSSTAKVTFQIASPKVLFVTQSPLNAGDADFKARLESLNCIVSNVADTLSKTEDATGQDLIVISSTSYSGNVNTKFAGLAIPILTWESHLEDDLNMTGLNRFTDYYWVTEQTQISLNSSIAGLTGVQTVYSTGGKMSWGKPGAGAKNIASLVGDPNKSVFFVYEAGAPLFDGTPAPEKRIFIFLEDNEASSLSSTGSSIINAAIVWGLR